MKSLHAGVIYVEKKKIGWTGERREGEGVAEENINIETEKMHSLFANVIR